MAELVYRCNHKHKPGASGEGPPRWFPDSASQCPDDIGMDEASLLLQGSVEGRDMAHPNRRARYAMDESGRFFKGYPEAIEGDSELWHGYPVAESLVPRQVPSGVLRKFVAAGKLSRARYKKLLGSA